VRRWEPGGSFGSRLTLIVKRFPLDTLRAITTRPQARSHHNSSKRSTRDSGMPAWDASAVAHLLLSTLFSTFRLSTALVILFEPA
jgi:hypothetical protein